MNIDVSLKNDIHYISKLFLFHPLIIITHMNNLEFDYKQIVIFMYYSIILMRMNFPFYIHYFFKMIYKKKIYIVIIINF